LGEIGDKREEEVKKGMCEKIMELFK
jgi:hypothetical protein